MEFQGRVKDFPRLSVPIGLPKYRLANGRTLSSQEEYLATHPEVRSDLFISDPELVEAQEAQHGILVPLASKESLLAHFEQPSHHQIEPLILDENGFVVNGNRRLAAWRELYLKDSDTYRHFEYVDVVVLPHCEPADIDKLEARLQIQEDIKADYEWHSEAALMQAKLNSGSYTLREVADLYGKRESEVKELTEMRELARHYLASIDKVGMWSEVTKDELAFKRLVQSHQKPAPAGHKALLRAAAFLVIENPQSAGRRLYEVVPNIQEFLEPIETQLRAEIPVAESEESGADWSEMLGVAGDRQDVGLKLAEKIQEPELRDKARELILGTIAHQRQLKVEQQAANFLLDKVTRANTALQDAITGGLKEGSDPTGVAGQLDQLEQSLHTIRGWLATNANS